MICYVMGDFNMNLMNYQSHNLTGEFLDTMYSNTFFPLTRPTRITSHSATLFDLLITYFKILFKIFCSVDYYLPIFLIIYQEPNPYLILLFIMNIVRTMCPNFMIPFGILIGKISIVRTMQILLITAFLINILIFITPVFP